MKNRLGWVALLAALALSGCVYHDSDRRHHHHDRGSMDDGDRRHHGDRWR
ncbi:hypothetical protein [Entomohabitans teleogrylli]|nr:hypothetical protein [Entomohabitans teleogrylli]